MTMEPPTSSNDWHGELQPLQSTIWRCPRTAVFKAPQDARSCRGVPKALKLPGLRSEPPRSVGSGKKLKQSPNVWEIGFWCQIFQQIGSPTIPTGSASTQETPWRDDHLKFLQLKDIPSQRDKMDGHPLSTHMYIYICIHMHCIIYDCKIHGISCMIVFQFNPLLLVEQIIRVASTSTPSLVPKAGFGEPWRNQRWHIKQSTSNHPSYCDYRRTPGGVGQLDDLNGPEHPVFVASIGVNQQYTMFFFEFPIGKTILWMVESSYLAI